MKCFFDFRVKGSRLLAICLGYLICLWAVFGVVMWSSSAYTMNRMMMTAGMPMAGFAANNAPLVSLGVQLIYFVVSIFLGFFLITECVKGLSFKGYSLQPHYDLGKYVGQVVTGFLLTLITIGIYYPWFITKITRFFASGTTYRDQPFAFNGKGATLFFFMTCVLFIPYIFLLGIFYFSLYVAMKSGSAGFAIISPLCLVAILLLYGLYCAFVYRWLIDFTYGNSRIALKVSIPVTMLFMFIQIVLCILTAGLFVPIAGVMI